jgi:hypothetical protein
LLDQRCELGRAQPPGLKELAELASSPLVDDRAPEGGMRAELSVTLPATSAPAAIEQHLQHFSVEFRSWMRRAAAETPAR